MKLYYLPLSPFSQKVQMALFIKGTECDKEVVIPLDPEERAVYRELFPLGKLPLLIDGDKKIHESSFIVEYLDDLSGGPKFLPEKAEDNRAVRYKDRLVDNFLIETSIALMFQSLRPEEKRDQNSINQSLHRIRCTYAMIEEMLKETEGEFFHGDAISLADLSLAPALRGCYNQIAFDDYRYISAYYEKWQSHEGLKEIEKEAAAHLNDFIALATK